MSNTNLLNFSPSAFVNFLKENNIKRFYFIYLPDEKRVVASHEVLSPIADFITSDKRDFDTHEGMFFSLLAEYNTILGAFVHRTNRGQAAGGVRYWSYKTMEDYFRDGMRLGKGMTQKNALAGLWWGGGKGVIAHNPDVDKYDPEIRKIIYSEYGKFMTSLAGCYITAEDVGTNVEDMQNVFSQTRFTTCIPDFLGGSGNPSVPTAKGVVSGMEAALEFRGMGSLEGKTIAVQGMGNVGAPLIRFLFEKGVKKIIACDVNEKNVNKLKNEFPEKLEASLVEINDKSIFAADCDILAPCATGAILNPETIGMLKTKIICGAANNQLEDTSRDDKLIFEKGITYIPDFLTNRMGIVNCANEQYGYIKNDPAIEQHFNPEWEYSVYKMAMEILTSSKAKNIPPAVAASQKADELSRIDHPVMGHRGEMIIKSLMEQGWEKM